MFVKFGDDGMLGNCRLVGQGGSLNGHLAFLNTALGFTGNFYTTTENSVMYSTVRIFRIQSRPLTSSMQSLSSSLNTLHYTTLHYTTLHYTTPQ